MIANQPPRLMHWAGHSIWYDDASADLYYQLEFVKSYRTLADAKRAATKRAAAIRWQQEHHEAYRED